MIDSREKQVLADLITIVKTLTPQMAIPPITQTRLQYVKQNLTTR